MQRRSFIGAVASLVATPITLAAPVNLVPRTIPLAGRGLVTSILYVDESPFMFAHQDFKTSIGEQGLTHEPMSKGFYSQPYAIPAGLKK